MGCFSRKKMCYTHRMPENYPAQYQFCPMCGETYRDILSPTSVYVCQHCQYQVYDNLNATGSAIIMRNTYQEVLLVKRALDPQKGLWDVVGGFSDPTEHPEDTVHREVEEELGVKIEIEKLWGIYAPVEYPYQGYTRYNCDLFYLAHITEGEPHAADDAEEYRWFSLNKIPPQEEIAFTSAQKALQEIQETFSNA